MKIATYNVNSINARIENLINWLNKEQPDVVLLQEIKCDFNSFPFFDLQAVGYETKILGQKSYNGVAILSKFETALF
jgi:exodeoxyribonuclease-3